MQCKQCGKWFVEKSVDEIYCSLECWSRAQLGGIKYRSPKLYHNGEEVKTIKNFDIKGCNYETSAIYSDHA